MKVLLCERNLGGHRKVYLKWLSQIEGLEFYSYAPENTGFPEDRYFPFPAGSDLRSYKEYISWVGQIRRIVKQNGIDVVHILDGDSLMRYFGYGLHMPGGCRVVITYHNFYSGLARRISYRLMNSGRNNSCVVHTGTLKRQMESAGLKQVAHCEYPAFEFYTMAGTDPAECKRSLGLCEDIPVIGIVGGLNKYKNILPFLRILGRCGKDFQLLICGKPSEVTGQEIEEAVAPYREKVHLLLRLLTDDEYRVAIAACDIIYSIYRRDFQGASGPLTDGVCCGKMILSSDHGSLGEITADHMLGITADVTDEGDILAKTESALDGALSFRYGEKAEAYRNSLKPEAFMETYKQIYLGKKKTR